MKRNRPAIPQIIYILEKMDEGYKPKIVKDAKQAFLIKKRHKIPVMAAHVKSAQAVRADYKAGKFPRDYGVDHLKPNQIRFSD